MSFQRRTTAYVFEAGRTEIRASLNEYRGRVYLDLRHFYEPAPGEPMLPTKKGISVPADCLDELQAALDAFRAALSPNRRGADEAA